jgi:hypothetical protein
MSAGLAKPSFAAKVFILFVCGNHPRGFECGGGHRAYKIHKNEYAEVLVTRKYRYRIILDFISTFSDRFEQFLKQLSFVRKLNFLLVH